VNWFKLAKFINNKSAICGFCFQGLKPTKIMKNNRHIYNIGTFYVCSCGKSSIWTNSLRNEDNFIKYIEEGTRYYNGFCTDLFCGVCFSNIIPKKNGFMVNNFVYDKFGCNSCNSNQNILMDLDKEYKESETGQLVDWYKTNIDNIKNIQNDLV
jgi:hypothetical protein